MWYKVVFDRDGAVKSCSQVSAVFKGDTTTVYIDAEDSVQACIEAKRLYVNNYRRAERSAHRAAGTCRECGAPAAPGFVRCDDHLVSARKAAARRREVKRAIGLPVETPLPVEYRLKKSAGPTGFGAQSRERRRRILVEVRQAYDSKNKTAFRAWLLREIDKVSAPEETHLRLVK